MPIISCLECPGSELTEGERGNRRINLLQDSHNGGRPPAGVGALHLHRVCVCLTAGTGVVAVMGAVRAASVAVDRGYP